VSSAGQRWAELGDAQPTEQNPEELHSWQADMT